MIRLFNILKVIVIFGILTLYTQIGGIIYLLIKPLTHFASRKINHRWKKRALRFGIYFLGYLIIVSFIVPPIAKRFGREPLPVFSNKQIKPLNVITCLLNRHYVRPTLRKTLDQVASKLNQTYPNTVMAYMDANFPFKNGYPLWPHLSHSDGKKVDLAFLYKDSKSGKPLHKTAKTWLGYGGSETPKMGEYNVAKICKKQGHWQYSLITDMYPQWLKKDIKIDIARTRRMVQLFAQHPRTQVLYIEPYLKQRWGTYHPKIAFHGCHAVLHDDHLHLAVW